MDHDLTVTRDRLKNRGENVAHGLNSVGFAWFASLSLLAQQTCLIAVATLMLSVHGLGVDRQLPLANGPAIGSEVTSFYVRAVTGPHAGKSVCYVCRNGDRPVVMVFLREITPNTTALLKRMDKVVNERRADGLRCFVVLLSDSPQKDAAKLQTLAFDEKLDLPLTLASESMIGANSANLSSDAAITIVLYDQLKVSEGYSYRASECDDDACKTVVNAMERLAKRSAQ